MSKVINWIKSLIIICVPLFITVFFLEAGSRIVLDWGDKKNLDYSDYFPKELDKSLPFIAERNGSRCIEFNTKFNWNQWWGFTQKNLDFECAKKHFSDNTFNVVFMGGSAMYSRFAPNFLTTIDYLATKDLNNVRSINLSETNARHMNMSIRFQREVKKLNPNLVIFFDGFSEFNSISYRGRPSDDYYWTATGKNRMHQHYRLYIDKAIMLSAFLELILVHTGLYQSSRNMTGVMINEIDIEKSALTYLSDKQTTQILCKAFEIKCVFIIHPHIYSSQIDEHLDIISSDAQKSPFNEMIIEKGFNFILERCNDCIDFSKVLNNIEQTFVDPVHFLKKGNIKIAELFRKIINKNMNNICGYECS